MCLPLRNYSTGCGQSGMVKIFLDKTRLDFLWLVFISGL